MIIDVFGEYINPHHVVRLSKDSSGNIIAHGDDTWAVGMWCGKVFAKHEIAEEINRLEKENK
jgi:hypothetical protein